MTTKSVRKLWMSPNLRTALDELAWRERVTASDIVRELIQDIHKRPNPAYLPKLTDVSDNITRSVSVLVEDVDWERARDAAWPTRISVAKQVRLRLIRRLDRAGITVAA